MGHKTTTKKAQFLPLFNINLFQLQLNSTSTQFQLNFNSTSCPSHCNLSLNNSLNSTLTLTSTQYDCDIKETQSCFPKFCNIVNMNGFRVETTNNPTDRIFFLSSGSQMVKLTRGLKYRLDISPNVGFSVVNFLIPDFPISFVKRAK